MLCLAARKGMLLRVSGSSLFFAPFAVRSSPRRSEELRNLAQRITALAAAGAAIAVDFNTLVRPAHVSCSVSVEPNSDNIEHVTQV